MAHVMKAIQAYSPRAKVRRMVEMDEVVRYISDRTGLNSGVLYHVLMELHASLFLYLKDGYSLKLPGLGSFAPTLNKEGSVGINYRPDKQLIIDLNHRREFAGDIRNKKMIGKPISDFIKRWNDEHPDDPIPVDNINSTG